MRYLDHAATTPLRPEARAAMAPYLDEVYGNPSGMHGAARRAKNALEAARERAASLLGAAHPLEIVFTGGGTEGDNLAVAGAVLARDAGGAVTTAIEHPAVLETCAFLQRLGRPVRIVTPEPSGRVDPAAVAAAVGADTVVVSVMAANNETGVLQPVAEVAAAVHAARPDVLVHTDAVQAFVSEPVTVAGTGADLLSLAAHKFGGPAGVGLLYVRDGVPLEPVLHGGGQELGRRSGTHDVAGVVGMVAAMEATVAERPRFRARVGAARDRFETVLRHRLPDVVPIGVDVPRLAQHALLRFPGILAETLLVRLDQAGIAASAGSACHSGARRASHVLAAMGIPEDAARECVRFTFGRDDGPDDGEAAAIAVAAIAAGLR